MSWIADRNITPEYVDGLLQGIKDRDNIINYLVERTKQMACAESDVVREHIDKTIRGYKLMVGDSRL